jgi:hypothetical protein
MPIGRKNAQAWAAKLDERGHRVAWVIAAEGPFERWRGSCRSCGGVIVCGAGLAASEERPDMRRKRACSPRLRRRRGGA